MSQAQSDPAVWHLARDGGIEGPFNDDELRSFVAEGSISPSDLVWTAGFPEWSPAGSVEGLFIPPPIPKTATPHERAKPPRAKRRQVDRGVGRPKLTANEVLDLEAGIDPEITTGFNTQDAIAPCHDYRFKNWPVVGSCIAGIFLGWILMLPSMYIGLPLFILLGFIVMPVFCFSYVVSEGKGGLMTQSELTFPATARWAESPIPLPYRDTISLAQIWEASSFKDSQGWYVDLSGEFGGKTVRLMSKAMRDQFYAELRRRAPHVRIFRGR